jgi:iron(III) transport system permease protein
VARTLASSRAGALPRVGQRDRAAVVTAAVVVGLLAVFGVWPLVRVLGESLRASHVLTLARDGLTILGQTVAVCAVSTTITVLLALVLAYAVTRTDIPGRRVVALAGLLPMAAPPFLAALVLMLLFGHHGLVTPILVPGTSIEGAHGIVASQVITFLPHAFLLLAGALAAIEPALEEAAENLGAATLTILWRITLVLTRPRVASAVLVVFILCMTDFANPILIGGAYRVLTTEIYLRAVGMNDLASAAVMSVVLIVPCLLAYVLTVSWVGARSYGVMPAVASTALRRAPPPVRAVLFVVAAGIALVMILVYAVIPLSGGRHALGSLAGGARPIWDSVRLAITAAVIGTGLALVTAYIVERRRASVGWATARAIEALSLVPAALPGTVVGLGYVLAFAGSRLPLAGTLWIVVASVVFWKLPVAVRAALATVSRIDPAIEEAAVSLGAGRLRTFTRVILPLGKGSALSIFVYFFINGMVTVSAVIFLVVPGFVPASVAILARAQRGELEVACALSTVVLGIVLGAIALLWTLVGGERMAVLEL